MKIACFEIANFRKLKLVRIDLQANTTLLVGANNSGKTTAMDALRQFLTGQPFNLTDFTISDLSTIRTIGEEWEQRETTATAENSRTPEDDFDRWLAILPTLDLWIEALEEELYMAGKLLPLLDEYSGAVGIRLRFQPRDIESLRRNYLRVKNEVDTVLATDHPDEDEVTARLWPRDLADYLEAELRSSFELKMYKLDPLLLSPALSLSSGAKIGIPLGEHVLQRVDNDDDPLAIALLQRLVRVDYVDAQRGLSAEVGSNRLSTQVAQFYARHLDPGQKPDIEDLKAIRTTQKAASSFDERLEALFKGSLDEIASMGYPGSTNPTVVIRTKLQLTDGLRHDSVLRYRLDTDSPIPLELPEGLNGLGYQNLVLMIFSLMSFRRSRLKPDRNTPVSDQLDEIRPLHLVLVEEPEAHLHAQVQQVFIKRAYATLTADLAVDHPDLTTQLVISTHSSHVAHEIDFEQIRYFRRVPAEDGGVPLAAVENLTGIFGDAKTTERFVKRYIRLNHCNLLFADALIVVEGAAETLLVPEFVRTRFPLIDESYLEYLEIGGAHAHRLRPLIDVLRIPTLVITDIDAQDSAGRKARPERGAAQTTSNVALRKWLAAPVAMDDLMDISNDDKTLKIDEVDMTRFAFQTSTAIDWNQKSEVVIPSTFEDALVLANLETFAAMPGGGLAKKFRRALDTAEATPNTVAIDLFAALKKGTKAEFALEVLMQVPDLSDIVPPSYIEEGLTWLESKVSTLGIVGNLSVPTPADEA